MHKIVKNVQNLAFNSSNICKKREIFIPLRGKIKEINQIIN